MSILMRISSFIVALAAAFAPCFLCAADEAADSAAHSETSADFNNSDEIIGRALGALPYADVADDELSDSQREEIARVLKDRYSAYAKASQAIAERLKGLTGELISEGGSVKVRQSSRSKTSSSKSLKSETSKSGTSRARAGTSMPIDLPDGGSDDASKGVLSVSCKLPEGLAAGTAFIARMRGNLFVVTNLHVVRDAEEISMRTIDGEELKLPNVMYIAKNQDAVLFPIRDLPGGSVALEVLEDVSSKVHMGDIIVACGNSQGKGSFLRSAGEVVAIGPSIIEMNCAIFKGNSGSPIYHAATRSVIGVVSHLSAGSSNPFDAATKMRSNSPIKSSIRYFGQRIDSTKHWEKINRSDFLTQCRDIRIFEDKIKVIAAYENKKALVMSGYAYEDFYKIVRPFSSVRNYSSAYKTEARNCFESLSNLMKHEAALVKARKFSSAFDSEVSELLGFFERQRQVYEERAKSFDR